METDAETQSKTLTHTQVSCRIEKRRIVGAREVKKNPENKLIWIHRLTETELTVREPDLDTLHLFYGWVFLWDS